MATIDEETEAMLRRHREEMREISDRDRKAVFRLASINNLSILTSGINRRDYKDLADKFTEVVLTELVDEHLTTIREAREQPV